ncbi:MAG: CtsR family transcriptional regulator [Christensenellales bacterium]
MAKLSDIIEKFIKSMLADEEAIELQRNDMAQYFGCAPSQINYVLTTRFSLERGYVIESRKGSGGYIRIIRLNPDADDYMSCLLSGGLPADMSWHKAKNIIEGLLTNEVIEEETSHIMMAAVSDKALSGIQGKDTVRAGIIREMLLALIGKGGKENEMQ